MIDALPLLLGPEGYQISRSVRLRSSASAYFNRTLTTPTDGKKWTYSVWVKRGILTAGTGTAQQLLSAGSATAFFRFSTTDTLVSGWTGAANLETTQVFRDPSAWYHIMLVVDTTQATASNRVKYYVNGTQITAFATTDYPTQNSTTTINSAVAHNIGAYTSSTQYLDGYLTEVNFIDGQALTPSSFGETNTVTGVWQPKKYTGTYGTNGFYLNFSDNSAATAAAIGKDYSGNGNNWTPNNISVTAGVTYDSMLDVPTQWADGGNGRGNYAVLNPLDYVAAAFSGTASNGNLTVSIPAPANSNGIASTIRVVSAAQPKFYIETTITALNTICSLGMISGTNANYRLRHTADITLAVNDVVMTAFDPETGNIWYGRNGTWLSSGNPAAGTNPFYTIPSTEIVGSAYAILATNGSTGTFTTSTTFGQQPFTYTPPSGFRALNTLNLPTPTISNGATVMAATLYTGNATARTIDNSVNGVSFQPDWVWIKSRSATTNNQLVDAVRGTSLGLSSNLTSAEYGVGVNAFASNGFGLTTDGSLLGVNVNAATYVAWQWKEGATQGFDIVTYTGNGTNPGRTVAHNLGVTPAMIITKSRSGTGEWPSYHKSLPISNTLYLNATYASTTYLNRFSAVSSTDFTTGSNGSELNTNGVTYVAYLFAEVAGFSKFGSYTGNGSTDGPFVFCGFRPRWILVKNTSAVNQWNVWDTARNTFNVMNDILVPSSSGAETNAYPIDITANGFKIRGGAGLAMNDNGNVYIFAAFAESPFKNSLAR